MEFGISCGNFSLPPSVPNMSRTAHGNWASFSREPLEVYRERSCSTLRLHMWPLRPMQGTQWRVMTLHVAVGLCMGMLHGSTEEQGLVFDAVHWHSALLSRPTKFQAPPFPSLLRNKEKWKMPIFCYLHFLLDFKYFKNRDCLYSWGVLKSCLCVVSVFSGPLSRGSFSSL